MGRVIELAPYQESWVSDFVAEAQKIQDVLQENCDAIHHIGSTAIPGIYAKPVIDILVTVDDLAAVGKLNSQFSALGYECLGELGIQGRCFYRKGKPGRTHHIHLFQKNNPQIERHIAFRDYLQQHPNETRAYSWIKRCLAEQFRNDIDAYVNGKDSFIRAIDYRTGHARLDQLQAKDNIMLEPYNPNWQKLAVAEINAIQQVVSLPFVAIEHLGSTAVEGLCAKPIIDIFITLENLDNINQWAAALKALGYVDWPENPNKIHLRFFKGMPPFGVQRTHHVHIMPMDDEFKQRVAFRDLLRQQPALRAEYQALKKALASQHADDREAYTNAKAQFIKQHLT